MRGFLRSKAGVAGLVLLLILVVLGIIGPWIVPFPGAGAHWHDTPGAAAAQADFVITIVGFPADVAGFRPAVYWYGITIRAGRGL